MLLGSHIVNHTAVHMFQTRFDTIIVTIAGMGKQEFIGKCDNDMIDAIWALMRQTLEA